MILIVHCSVKKFYSNASVVKISYYLGTTLFHEKTEMAYRNIIKRIQINKRLTEGTEINTLCKVREREADADTLEREACVVVKES